MAVLNILLIAEDAAGVRALQCLRQSTHRVISVMTSADRQNSAQIARLANAWGYEVLPSRLVKDPAFASQVRKSNIDIILNVHSLYLIHESVLDAPRLGSYNLHPGPLPRYAGLNSVCWAIYRGEEAHGVTLHKMQAEIDTGPIAFQELFDIADADTGLSLTLKCVNIGIPMVNKLLYAAQEPTGIPLRPQDLALRLYFGREAPRKGILCWGSPAKQVQNSVRACTFFPYRSPWGYPRTAVSGREIQIAKVQRTNRTSSAPPGRVGEVKKSGVEVSCCDEWIIVEKVFRNGELIPAKDVLHRGDDLRTPIE